MAIISFIRSLLHFTVFRRSIIRKCHQRGLCRTAPFMNLLESLTTHRPDMYEYVCLSMKWYCRYNHRQCSLECSILFILTKWKQQSSYMISIRHLWIYLCINGISIFRGTVFDVKKCFTLRRHEAHFATYRLSKGTGKLPVLHSIQYMTRQNDISRSIYPNIIIFPRSLYCKICSWFIIAGPFFIRWSR